MPLIANVLLYLGFASSLDIKLLAFEKTPSEIIKQSHSFTSAFSKETLIFLLLY